MSKAIVLLSGGQDSTTCLYWALARFSDVRAVSIFYGQRHERELDAAEKIAHGAGVPHCVLAAPVLSHIGDSALVDPARAIAGSGGHADREMPQGLPTSFVPGRNLLFLTLATAIAVREGASDIVTGVCQTDYSGYPDCRRDFIDSLEKTLGLAMPSSAGPFHIHTPLMNLTKAETVKLAKQLGDKAWAALSQSVTCYEGQHPGCGKCPACELRAKGFAEAGEIDPARAA